jgi:hypothetical protein
MSICRARVITQFSLIDLLGNGRQNEAVGGGPGAINPENAKH